MKRETQCWGIKIQDTCHHYDGGVSWDMGIYVEGRTHAQLIKEPYLRERIKDERG